MSAERNEAIMRVYVHDIAAAGRVEMIEEIAHPDMIDVAVTAAGGPAGTDGLRLHLRDAQLAVSNRKAEIKRLVANDDEVMAWWTLTGTHTAAWLGFEPTGRAVTFTAFSFFRVRNGRLYEYEYWVDVPGLLQQLRDGAATSASRSV